MIFSRYYAFVFYSACLLEKNIFNLELRCNLIRARTMSRLSHTNCNTVTLFRVHFKIDCEYTLSTMFVGLFAHVRGTVYSKFSFHKQQKNSNLLNKNNLITVCASIKIIYCFTVRNDSRHYYRSHTQYYVQY